MRFCGPVHPLSSKRASTTHDEVFAGPRLRGCIANALSIDCTEATRSERRHAFRFVASSRSVSGFAHAPSSCSITRSLCRMRTSRHHAFHALGVDDHSVSTLAIPTFSWLIFFMFCLDDLETLVLASSATMALAVRFSMRRKILLPSSCRNRFPIGGMSNMIMQPVAVKEGRER